MRYLLFLTLLASACMSKPTANSVAPTGTNPKTDGTKTLYSFPEQNRGNWRLQNDTVMGGRSQADLSMTDEGHARFSGRVSLENNGGFCSIHQETDDPYVVADKSSFQLRLQGDGADYKFRVRTPNGRHLYGFTFPTQAGKWETISIPFAAMTAQWRGRDVDVPNYAGEDILEMQLLIGNGKEQSFVILVEEIAAL